MRRQVAKYGDNRYAATIATVQRYFYAVSPQDAHGILRILNVAVGIAENAE
jgi:hypothetical protein